MRRFGRLGVWGAGTLMLAAAWLPLTRGVADPDPSECTSEPVAVTAADTTSDLRLALNVPAYRLDVIEGGAVTRTIHVAVGQPKYPTPRGQFRVDYLIWNPWWRPPPSEWARKERPKPPGWSNPVGRVKLHVHDLVFLHGTPYDSSLGKAASHACVRMSNQDAIALAQLVLEYAGPVLEPALIDSLVADTARTHTVPLVRAVPIDVVYELAEVDGAELVIYPDIYRLGGRRAPDAVSSAAAALVRAGHDTSAVSMRRVRALARTARRAPARLAIDTLLGTPAAASW